MTAGALTAGTGTASAATPSNVDFRVSKMQSDGSRSVLVVHKGRAVGAAYWQANGDTLKAVDTFADGYGVAAYLGTSPVREASTYGRKSPYTATKGGNLKEGKKYTFWVCFGGQSGQLCSAVYNVKS
ncbi:hypothetical protein IGX29_15800 [Streptomyces sp. H28]|uniref:hypothetical protein n=1 Tax=Streptomyces sp. H28 TaxID=2775865 RepID=UPI0019B0989D|nr:hypothetical protein [Streptomyces sp. H28]